MAESSSLLQEPSLASNGTFEPNAKVTTERMTTSALSAVPKTTHSPPESVSNYEKIVTPLSADGFDTLLRCYNLTSRYSTLSSDLHNGLPLGKFDKYLKNSYDHPNHSNAFPHVD
jgi:hypothetical protein